eukprot:TRINITY_DN48040_c0_g1_i1.p1 TRINITY_DN48040_c0_g1~~TRINITY_DN48040_c0_g1_i1.p1  ORF type:complete len:248 (-),score=43.29 TRINITY_DN48040_c0_g1_i1:85-828(-)
MTCVRRLCCQRLSFSLDRACLLPRACSSRGNAGVIPGVTYAFGGTVYVSLTNECNAGLTMLAANGPKFTFPPGTGFEPLPEGKEPSSDDVVAAVLAACETLDKVEGAKAREVVFAGLGEPLLRLPVMLSVIHELGKRTKIINGTRLNTNGLLPAADAEESARSLSKAGLQRACVQLQTADVQQHTTMVRPRAGLSLDDACAFAKALASAGVAVDCSAIDRGDVDLDAVEKLALSLGAQRFIKRPYFP